VIAAREFLTTDQFLVGGNDIISYGSSKTEELEKSTCSSELVDDNNFFQDQFAENSRGQISLGRVIACRANANATSAVAAASPRTPSSRGRTAARTSTTSSSRVAFETTAVDHVAAVEVGIGIGASSMSHADALFSWP
jgi:hypothetical protein